MRTCSITTKERKLLNKLLFSYLEDINNHLDRLAEEVFNELLRKFED